MGLFASKLGGSDPATLVVVAKRSGGCRATGGSAGGSAAEAFWFPLVLAPFLGPYSAFISPSLVVSASWSQI